MTFISFAQNFEDVMLWRALSQVEGGFYIDVGAHHPDFENVTRAFSDRGWHGVNIEPLRHEAALLRAARPRDVTIQAAIGAEPGTMPFYVVEGTGLSTLDAAVASGYDSDQLKVSETRIEVLTLAQICQSYASGDIHFLKIDVEGAERAVLQGADLIRFRPWIILAEATAPRSTTPNHEAWEGLLLAADYEFVWFDGLNRFYVAGERAASLRPAFAAPPNVFDTFVRVGDNGWIGRFAAVELENRTMQAQLRSVQHGLEQSAKREQHHVERATHDIGRLREALSRATIDLARLGAEAESLRHRLATSEQMFNLRHRDIEDLRDALHRARHELQQTHLRLQASERDWHRLAQGGRQLLAAIPGARRVRRGLRRALRRDGARQAAPPEPALPPAAGETPPPQPADPPSQAEAPLPIAPPPGFAIAAAPGNGLTSVHQFHSGSAVNDAITNSMLLTRGLLRAMGYDSEIYTEQPPPELAGELRIMEELPRHDRYVLLVHHSIGYDRFRQILDLPMPKILIYHNITPPALLTRHPHLAHYARLGMTQLGAFSGKVAAALPVSAYSAGDLRRHGIGPIRACNLLFDLDALRQRAAGSEPLAASLRRPGLFTLLFVGRINESKGQVALVQAYAAFRAQFDAPSRLVLVGRDATPGDPYASLLRATIDEAGLADHVLLTGGVDDAQLDGWYGAADLYVSLSRHEGFGVPLVEAMVHGVPVLAHPGGAVPYTLAGAGRLLTDPAPEPVAAAMLALAEDPTERDRMRAAQRAALDRFALPRQAEILRQALLRAGAALPDDPATPALLADNLRFSVTGHVNGSYSLAAINRDLALALDQALPARVRLAPVEGGATLDLSGVPASQAAAVARLVFQPPHPTGPELVISQHYPVHVPERGADLAVALLFWEESRLPAETIAVLGQGFDAVVAPSRFVRDALVDSGLAVPVRVIPPAFRLQPFAALRARRVPGPSPAHRFLHVSSCFPRKGVDVLLRAWARAFRDTDPVRLVIKGFPNPHNAVAQALDALRAADPGLAPVTLIDRDLDEAALLALYEDADTMVLPTRGEGLNLPAAEALQAGLGLIVTGAGGHMDFCTADGAPLAGVRLLGFRHAPSGSHLATPHSLWLEPDEDDLVAALRERVAAAPARSAAPALAGPEALARAYAALGRDLLRAGPRTPVRVSWITSWAVRCGVAEYSRQLLGALPRIDDGGHGMQVHVLCDRRTAPDPGDRDAAWPCWNAGDPRTVAPMAAAIGADDAQAVMLQHQPGLFSFPQLADLITHPAVAGRAVLVTLHNTVALLELDADRLARVLAALRQADRLFVHTMADLDRLRGLGVASAVTLLPHGVPAALPPPPVRRLAPDAMDPGTSDDPVIGCYGFFLPGKGIDVLIEALAILRRRWPRARLLLVNAEYDHPFSREEIARCSARIATLGLADAVRLETDFMPNYASLELLTGCDVVALPYLPSKEASSAALRGALAAGAPVAVTPIALFEEAGAAVFKFAGHTAEAVAAGLDRLLRDEKLRLGLQQAAQGWMAQRRWGDIARQLEGTITGLVRSREIDGFDEE